MPSISFICEDLVKIFIKKTVVIPNLSNHIAQIQIFFFFSVIIISKESIYLSFKYIPFLNYFLFILLNTLSDYYPHTYHEFNLEEKDTLFFNNILINYYYCINIQLIKINIVFRLLYTQSMGNKNSYILFRNTKKKKKTTTTLHS
jgi:hypothetical protein